MYICWTICKAHKRLGREKIHVKSFWLRMTDNVSLRAVMLARNKVVMNIYAAPPLHAPVLFMQTSTQLLVQGVYKQRRKQIIGNNRQNQTVVRILRSEHLEWRVWSNCHISVTVISSAWWGFISDSMHLESSWSRDFQKPKGLIWFHSDLWQSVGKDVKQFEVRRWCHILMVGRGWGVGHSRYWSIKWYGGRGRFDTSGK